LVYYVGCGSLSLADKGLFSSDTISLAGQKLADLCKTKNMLPCSYVGTCMDMSKLIFTLSTHKDIAVPVICIIPEWMGEKLLTMAFSTVCCGVNTVVGKELWVSGSNEVVELLTKGMGNTLGATLKYKEKLTPDVINEIL
jgi:carbon-monoxide dehydrogenase catalytic subunit